MKVFYNGYFGSNYRTCASVTMDFKSVLKVLEIEFGQTDQKYTVTNLDNKESYDISNEIEVISPKKRSSTIFEYKLQ